MENELTQELDVSVSPWVSVEGHFLQRFWQSVDHEHELLGFH
jgi:hypothetical protein